jgi:hypothetical protein
MQHYSDPARESDDYALPDIETFYRTKRAIKADDWRDDDGDLMGEGWYYWYCFPGCLPDSDPVGPFATEDEALADAREGIE